MDRPIPDGTLLITMREPYHKHDYCTTSVGVVHNTEAYIVRWPFDELDPRRGWRWEDRGVYIHSENAYHYYPWTSIQEFVVLKNSEEYHEQLKAYQKQHEHTWAELEPHTDPVTGLTVMHNDVFICDMSKQGELGCGALKRSGVVCYD